MEISGKASQGVSLRCDGTTPRICGRFRGNKNQFIDRKRQPASGGSGLHCNVIENSVKGAKLASS